jgi:hypothetical protein
MNIKKTVSKNLTNKYQAKLAKIQQKRETQITQLRNTGRALIFLAILFLGVAIAMVLAFHFYMP